MVTGYRVAPLSGRDIEESAASVRRALDVDPLMPLPGLELFERIGRHHVTVGRTRIGLTYAVEEELEGGALACASYDDVQQEIAIVLSSSSYADLERNGGRARFSVAHELGHAVLHAENLVHLTKIDHTRRAMLRTNAERTPLYRDSEWQANRFSAAILTPAPGLEYLFLRGRLTVSEVCRMFHVSRACAERRIREYNTNRKALLSGWNS